MGEGATSRPSRNVGSQHFLDAALSDLGRRVSTDVAPHTSVDAQAALTPNSIREIADRVGRMQCHSGNTQSAAQKRRKPLKNQLKKARQRVDWANRTVDWVVFEDVLEEVQAHGGQP